MPLIVIMQVQGMRVIRTNKNDKSLENSIHSLEAKIFLKYEENKLQHTCKQFAHYLEKYTCYKYSGTTGV